MKLCAMELEGDLQETLCGREATASWQIEAIRITCTDCLKEMMLLEIPYDQIVKAAERVE